MIRASKSYFDQQVRPRWREIATEPEAILAVGVGIAAGAWTGCTALGDSQVGDVLTVVMAYAAVAFGFSVAGLTVAMTLPDPRFADKLAKMDEDRATTWRMRRRAEYRDNAYARLLFVFSWTAVLHWGAIAMGFVMLVARGYDAKLLPDGASLEVRAILAVLTFFLVYAATQFLVTLITLSQAGNAYILELRSRSSPSVDE